MTASGVIVFLIVMGFLLLVIFGLMILIGFGLSTISEEIWPDLEGMAKTAYEDGRISEDLNDYNQALENYREADRLYKEFKPIENNLYHEDIERINNKLLAEKRVKVSQKVVHGDEVTKTEIKDSVVNKSNIGSGGEDKFTKLKELKEMLAEGLISDEEFEKIKKEIIG